MAKKAIRRAGRLLVREGKTAGLFIPFDAGVLCPGIWEVQEVLDTFQLVFIGPPLMSEAMGNGREIGDLIKEPSALMTRAELEAATAEPGKVK